MSELDVQMLSIIKWLTCPQGTRAMVPRILGLLM
jgi:hypothetical protein